MKRIIDITVDLKNKTYNPVFLKQMDTTEFIVKILDNNIASNLTGQTVDILFTRPDNTIVQQLSSNIDIENGVATIPLLPDCIRKSGKAKMEIEIKNTNEEIISSFYIPIIIEQTSKGNVNSENTPNYFEEFARSIENFKNNSTKMLEDISSAEQIRIQNEEDRNNAEIQREESEIIRSNTEVARNENEENRNNAETQREEAEIVRNNSEIARIENENSRSIAENLRIEAEAERANNYNALKNYLENNATIQYKYKKIITTEDLTDINLTIPCNYKVGQDVLDVYIETEKLLKSSNEEGTGGHYQEVGEIGSISNQIRITDDWRGDLVEGDVLEFVVRGEYTDDSNM